MAASGRTAIVGGTVVLPQGRDAAGLLIEDGVIVGVGAVDTAQATVIDAAGCLVLPGAVDAHTHPFGAVREATRSALCGGTTTALAFVDALPGEAPAQAAGRTLTDELPHSLIDLALHAVIWEPAAYRQGDLRAAAELGVGSVKLWLSYLELGILADDGVAFRVMQEAAELGMVVLAHCENAHVVDVLTRRLVEAGRLGTESLPASRPIEAEAECVHRFLALAEMAGATAYVVHVTGRRPLAEIQAARERGQRVYGEVCPHHLLFDVSDHAGPDALRYVMTPPLRTADDRRALLEALAGGALDTYASDHCHYRLEEKRAQAGDFTRIPTGLPGIGARLPVGMALAEDGSRLTVERLVEAACETPARIFGLYPRKGALKPGSDADVVVWDPRRPGRLSRERLADGLDWTPYDRIDIPGSIRHVLARGAWAVRDGRFQESGHTGCHLAAGRVAAPA
jgi:dihydropyrimidinase